MENQAPRCVECTVFRCGTRDKDRRVPTYCPTEKYPDLVKESIEKHNLPENRAINMAWRELMAKLRDPRTPGKIFTYTRVDEIVEYARIRGMKRLGIATCYATRLEAKLLADILKGNGFDVVSVMCLCGEVDPQAVGLEGGIMCNPIMQAEVLNRENTELNIMVGLCLGHDIMFLRYCQAETTPLVVKDRATGHNPVVALYLSQGYFKNRFFGK